MRKLLLAVLVGLALVAGQAQAVNKSYVIQSNVQIGSFNLRTDPTLQGAIAIRRSHSPSQDRDGFL